MSPCSQLRLGSTVRCSALGPQAIRYEARNDVSSMVVKLAGRMHVLWLPKVTRNSSCVGFADEVCAELSYSKFKPVTRGKKIPCDSVINSLQTPVSGIPLAFFLGAVLGERREVNALDTC